MGTPKDAKDPEPQTLQQVATPTPQAAQASEPTEQKETPEFTEPQKLTEPVSWKKMALEAPTPLPEKNPPVVQIKAPPEKLDESSSKRKKGSPRKKQAPAFDTSVSKP